VQVGVQEVGGGGFGQWEGVGDVGTIWLAAAVAVSDSWEADWVRRGTWDEAFEFFD